MPDDTSFWWRRTVTGKDLEGKAGEIGRKTETLLRHRRPYMRSLRRHFALQATMAPSYTLYAFRHVT